MDREVELREFVAARGAALSRTAYLLTGDHQAAEDLVQETYVVMDERDLDAVAYPVKLDDRECGAALRPG